MINTKDWKMGHYPMNLPKIETVDEALDEIESFNHKRSAAILRGAIDKVLSLHYPITEDGVAVGCNECDWDVPGVNGWPCPTYTHLKGTTK